MYQEFFAPYKEMTREEAMKAMNGKTLALPCCNSEFRVLIGGAEVFSRGITLRYYEKTDELFAFPHDNVPASNGILLTGNPVGTMESRGNEPFPFEIWAPDLNVWGFRTRSQRQQFLISIKEISSFLQLRS